MYCSGCGQLVPPGQQFCPHCGRPVPPRSHRRRSARALVLHTRPPAYSVSFNSVDRLRRLDHLRLADHHVHLRRLLRRLLRPLEPRAMERAPLRQHALACPAHHNHPHRPNHPGGRNRARPGQPRAVGQNVGDRRRLPHPHQAHHRNRARHLHPMGAAARPFSPGIRPDGEALTREY